MDDVWQRVAQNLADRLHGPLKLRFVFQPAMSALFAVTAGLRDATAGQPPYFWALLSNRSHRRELVRSGWKSVGKVFVLALIVDVVYQLVVLHAVYPGEAILVGLLLAIVPYLVLRGLVTRLWAKRAHPASRQSTTTR